MWGWNPAVVFLWRFTLWKTALLVPSLGISLLAGFIPRHFHARSNQDIPAVRFARNIAIAKRNIEAARDGDDYFAKPLITEKNTAIQPEDSYISLNFRGDRADPTFRLLDGWPEFKHWPLKALNLVKVAFGNYNDVYFKRRGLSGVIQDEPYTNTLGEVWSKRNLKQLRAAESEKFKHVTYFFDGLRDLIGKLPGPYTLLLPSHQL